MKLPHLLTTICLINFTNAADSNIVENGDFKSKRLKEWDIRPTKGYYTKDIEPKISKGSIQFSKLRGEYPRDLVFRQFVDLKPNTQYAVSFEAKGNVDPKNKIVFGVGRPHFACPKKDLTDYFHLKLTKLKITPEWQTFSYEFKTIYKTDNKDARKNGFNESAAKKEWAKATTDPGEAPTHVIFKLGDIEGDISIRNVQLVEKK
ncbi:carbohydrate binding domain-containing protein [Rubritalea tangerina]|uniref:Carbohydrate binding domain-containing protein n=1 Tax=Rubritalea tangerina TaxID=430798 RepID=A0ABW4ZDH3_9BACT